MRMRAADVSSGCGGHQLMYEFNIENRHFFAVFRRDRTIILSHFRRNG
jgi:hypothetical protein